jgi:hypothetical protein
MEDVILGQLISPMPLLPTQPMHSLSSPAAPKAYTSCRVTTQGLRAHLNTYNLHGEVFEAAEP